MDIPLGILGEPFYSLSYPEAVNYGAIGSVAGHELMYGNLFNFNYK